MILISVSFDDEADVELLFSNHITFGKPFQQNVIRN